MGGGGVDWKFPLSLDDSADGGEREDQDRVMDGDGEDFRGAGSGDPPSAVGGGGGGGGQEMKMEEIGKQEEEDEEENSLEPKNEDAAGDEDEGNCIYAQKYITVRSVGLRRILV